MKVDLAPCRIAMVSQYTFLESLSEAGLFLLILRPQWTFVQFVLLTYDNEFIFFGDKTDIGGNDYSIFYELENRDQRAHTVKDYKDTEQVLREEYKCQ